MNTYENKPLTPDELAVTDFISGLGKLSAPASPASPDRAHLEELMQIRGDVAAANISAPEMRSTFGDVMKRAGSGAKPMGRVLDLLSSRWGFRLTAAACVMLVFAVGTVATLPRFQGPMAGSSAGSPGSDIAASRPGNAKDGGRSGPNTRYVPNDGYSPTDGQIKPTLELNIPGDSTSTTVYSIAPGRPDVRVAANGDLAANTMVRKGSLGLRDKDPASIQRKITDELTAYGGSITRLTRTGVGEDTMVSMEVSVPSDKFGKFVTAVSSIGEVTSQSESAEDAAGDIIDNQARLAESQDYLKRLDALAEKPQTTLNETQNLENERRQTRLSIMRFQKALDVLKDRVAMASLGITIASKRAEVVPPPAPPAKEPPTQFQKALRDGIEGLMNFLAALLQIFLVTLPISIPLAIFLAALMIRRRRVPYSG